MFLRMPGNKEYLIDADALEGMWREFDLMIEE